MSNSLPSTSPSRGNPAEDPDGASSASCLLLFPPPVSCSGAAASVCEFDSVLMPCASAPAPRPAQVAAQWSSATAGLSSGLQAFDHSVSALASAGSTSFSARSAFLPPKAERRQVRQALSVLLERGAFSALEELARTASGDESGSVSGLWDRAVGSFAGAILAVLRAVSGLHASFNPHLTMSGEDMIGRFSETRDWGSSPVRCLAWHPHAPKFAAALRDDTIQVRGLGLPVSPTLKYKQQRGVACLAWRPYSGGDLAVGCLAGLLVWTVDPTSVAVRPSASSVTLLSARGHAPVTGLKWDPKGKLLLSCSAADTSMILWNTASETKTPLRRMGGGGVHLVSWSSSFSALNRGPCVLSATPSTVFRIWETRTWTSETWNVLRGRVQSACWSPSGSHLLFATSQEPTLFALDLGGGGGSSASSSPAAAVPVADLSAVAYDTEDGEEIILGGLVQSLRWDPLGERLAISFQDSDAVALFCTNEYPSLSLSPVGLIRGDLGESPVCIEFAGHFDEGALLTIAWSSGRLQHIPLLFVPNLNARPLPSLAASSPVVAPLVLNPDLDLSPAPQQQQLQQQQQQLFSPRTKDA